MKNSEKTDKNIRIVNTEKGGTTHCINNYEEILSHTNTRRRCHQEQV